MGLQKRKKQKHEDRNSRFDGLPRVKNSTVGVDVCLSVLYLRLSGPLKRDGRRKDTRFGQSEG